MSGPRTLTVVEAVIVAPATYNTINKLALGISDNYEASVSTKSNPGDGTHGKGTKGGKTDGQRTSLVQFLLDLRRGLAFLRHIRIIRLAATGRTLLPIEVSARRMIDPGFRMRTTCLSTSTTRPSSGPPCVCDR